MKKTITGYNLIELIIFIVILAVSIGALFPLITTMRHVYRIDYQTQAIELAQQRIELITAEHRYYGFTNMLDPCIGTTAPAVCNCTPDTGNSSICHSTVPPGFDITSNGNPFPRGDLTSSGWVTNPVGNYRLITVTVTGKAQATLTTAVANY